MGTIGTEQTPVVSWKNIWVFINQDDGQGNMDIHTGHKDHRTWSPYDIYPWGQVKQFLERIYF